MPPGVGYAPAPNPGLADEKRYSVGAAIWFCVGLALYAVAYVVTMIAFTSAGGDSDALVVFFVLGVWNGFLGITGMILLLCAKRMGLIFVCSAALIAAVSNAILGGYLQMALNTVVPVVTYLVVRPSWGRWKAINRARRARQWVRFGKQWVSRAQRDWSQRAMTPGQSAPPWSPATPALSLDTWRRARRQKIWAIVNSCVLPIIVPFFAIAWAYKAQNAPDDASSAKLRRTAFILNLAPYGLWIVVGAISGAFAQ